MIRVSLVVAVAENGVIGADGGLPWHLPADLAHFKALTMGKPMIMGRKTWDSIAERTKGRPLPGRISIVVSRDPNLALPAGVPLARSLDHALELAHGNGAEEAMVVGGAEIYAQALPLADRIYLTEVRVRVDGDARFPDFDRGQWAEVSRSSLPPEGDAPGCDFVLFERKKG